ncbi:PAS domain-containing protein [Pedobacter sp. Leaf250]|uniref:PAS domain-containing protein n=1 Tax=Pedobacter sp. Leaf250 TaxID=2876559 RepID=UPI001E28B875|nr:PAS domain-containing protein [Pedobacter sp. Leaf250]
MKIDQLWPLDGESVRLATIGQYKMISSPTEHGYDKLGKLACEAFDMPICLITLIDENQILIRAAIGISVDSSIPRSDNFISQLLPADTITIIKDADKIHELSTLLDHSIYYTAGVPMITSEGYNIGSIWLMDDKNPEPVLKKQDLLIQFARVTTDRMALWLIASDDAQIRLQNEQLLSQNEKAVEQVSHLKNFQDAISDANIVLEGVLDSYEMIFKHAPIAMGICSALNKNIWQANEAMKNAFGVGELEGRSLDELIISADGQGFGELLDQIHQQSKAYAVKESKLLINTNNETKHIYADISLQPVGRMGDEQSNIMFMIDDVTARVFSRQVMEESNQVLLNAIEDTGMGYTIVDFSTGKMNSNGRLKQNYGFETSEDFDYPDLFNAIMPEFRSSVKAAVDKAILNGSIYQAEYMVKWPNGSLHWLRAYGKPVYDADGKASHIIGFNKIIPTPN